MEDVEVKGDEVEVVIHTLKLEDDDDFILTVPSNLKVRDLVDRVKKESGTIENINLLYHNKEGQANIITDDQILLYDLPNFGLPKFEFTASYSVPVSLDTFQLGDLENLNASSGGGEVNQIEEEPGEEAMFDLSEKLTELSGDDGDYDFFKAGMFNLPEPEENVESEEVSEKAVEKPATKAPAVEGDEEESEAKALVKTFGEMGFGEEQVRSAIKHCGFDKEKIATFLLDANVAKSFNSTEGNGEDDDDVDYSEMPTLIPSHAPSLPMQIPDPGRVRNPYVSPKSFAKLWGIIEDDAKSATSKSAMGMHKARKLGRGQGHGGIARNLIMKELDDDPLFNEGLSNAESQSLLQSLNLPSVNSLANTIVQGRMAEKKIKEDPVKMIKKSKVDERRMKEEMRRTSQKLEEKDKAEKSKKKKKKAKKRSTQLLKKEPKPVEYSWFDSNGKRVKNFFRKGFKEVDKEIFARALDDPAGFYVAFHAELIKIRDSIIRSNKRRKSKNTSEAAVEKVRKPEEDETKKQEVGEKEEEEVEKVEPVKEKEVVEKKEGEEEEGGDSRGLESIPDFGNKAGSGINRFKGAREIPRMHRNDRPKRKKRTQQPMQQPYNGSDVLNLMNDLPPSRRPQLSSRPTILRRGIDTSFGNPLLDRDRLVRKKKKEKKKDRLTEVKKTIDEMMQELTEKDVEKCKVIASIVNLPNTPEVLDMTCTFYLLYQKDADAAANKMIALMEEGHGGKMGYEALKHRCNEAKEVLGKLDELKGMLNERDKAQKAREETMAKFMLSMMSRGAGSSQPQRGVPRGGLSDLGDLGGLGGDDSGIGDGCGIM